MGRLKRLRIRGAALAPLVLFACFAWLLAAFLLFTNWFDDHAGTVQAFLAGTLVIVTSAYALWTRQLWVTTERQRRPYVFFEVVQRGGLFDSAIRNSGERGASNVRVTVLRDVPFGDERGLLGWPMFEEPIPFLPPGRIISQLTFGAGHLTKLQKMSRSERVVRYRVQYEDGDYHYDEAYSYDLSFLIPVGGDPFPLAGDQLGQIKREIELTNRLVSERLDALQKAVRDIAAAIRGERTF